MSAVKRLITSAASSGGSQGAIRPPLLPSRPVPRRTTPSGEQPTSLHPAAAPLESMRVPKGTVPPDPDAAREWALRAAETKARIEAAEQREWQAQLARVKAEEARAEEAEWRALRDRAAQAEAREWQELLAKARRASITTPRAAPPARPARPSQQPAAQTVATATPDPRVAGARAASVPAQPQPVPTAGFAPFGPVTPAVATQQPTGRVVSWP
jgi:hypothetical protein